MDMKREFQLKIAIFGTIIFSSIFSGENANADHPRGGLDNGDVAPEFSLPDTDNQIVTLSDLRGSKNVVLVFYRGRF